ncbi:MAG TPA: flagellar biosynthesis protein FlgH, partial [Planctomycetaceae bacterium]|nr:flagellar biosynthesis protein FlgH [Planctomycetaceae bacterium]
AATIVDIRPNGNIVLEARKSIDANDDLWEYTLHGEIRFEDIAVNNTVLSENIANLNIEKRQKGRVHSSTNRRWGTKIMDVIWPF